jgi:hypothetical protein
MLVLVLSITAAVRRTGNIIYTCLRLSNIFALFNTFII